MQGSGRTPRADEPPGFRYACEPKRLRPGHQVDLLVDGDEVFREMLKAIATAKVSIWLETYIFESDQVGEEFIRALAQRARDGLEVLLLVDAFGGLELSTSDEGYMRQAGVEVVFFGRFNHLDFSRWIRRDHRKLLLVDREQAFVGGINISKHYASQERGGLGWHDIHVRIRGPVCRSLGASFVQTWAKAKGRHVASPRAPAAVLAPDERGEWAMALYANHTGSRNAIRNHLLHAIKRAENEVLLASAYFVPDRALMRALLATAKRGVEVRLLVPGKSDLLGVQRAGEHSYERLLRGQVHIHTYLGAHMHSKAAVVDKGWCTFGSFNLDYASLRHNLELVVEVVGPQSPLALAEHLRSDFAKSPEVDLQTWIGRPWSTRAYSRIAYQFRQFL